MLRTKTRQCLASMWGGVKRSPRQGFQGFTLAEVLITLGIIGVVAAMTIPTLVADYQKRTYDTAATTFERKLGEALKVMNSQSSLAGYATTEDFVQELSKHFKITKTCANDKLMDCFENEVLWGDNAEAVDMTVVKTNKNFGQDEWQESNVVGVQFASGVSALIAYNKDAKQDPYSNQIVNISGGSNGKSGFVSLGTNSLAILYDTNGAKSPNQSSKDLRSINVNKLGKGCFAEVNGICISMQPQVPTPHHWNTCDSKGNTTDPDDLKFMSDYGINKCQNTNYYPYDYWAGAVKLCGGTSKMASMAQLREIANYVYNTTADGKTFDTTKASKLGLPSPAFSLWSNQEYNNSSYSTQGGDAYAQYFDHTGTSGSTHFRHTNAPLAFCIE